MHEIPLNLSFKGGRDYVQGTDMYLEALLVGTEMCGNYPNQFVGTFHKLLKKQGIFRWRSDEREPFPEDIYARFVFTTGENKYYLGLFSTGKPITSVRPYDEEDLLRDSENNNKSIRMMVRKDFTYIEQIVSMTKRLHNVVYPEVRDKWLFTKIQIKDRLDPAEYFGHVLEIRAERKLQNILSQCSIFLNDQPLGSIFFTANSGGKNL